MTRVCQCQVWESTCIMEYSFLPDWKFCFESLSSNYYTGRLHITALSSIYIQLIYPHHTALIVWRGIVQRIRHGCVRFDVKIIDFIPGRTHTHTHILLNESGPARRLSDDVKYDTTLPQQTRALQRTFCVHESNGTLRNCLPNAKLSSRRRWWRSRL